MKFLLTLAFSLGVLFSNANLSHELMSQLTVPAEEICHAEIISQDESCTVIAIKLENNRFVLNVIAAIGVNLIPEAVEALCVNVGGDPSLCETVYDVSSAVVTLAGPGMYRGATKGLRWIASRGRSMGKATVETKTYQTASRIKRIFKAYNEYGCMEWGNVNTDSNEDYDYCTCGDDYEGEYLLDEYGSNNEPIQTQGREYSFLLRNKTGWELDIRILSLDGDRLGEYTLEDHSRGNKFFLREDLVILQIENFGSSGWKINSGTVYAIKYNSSQGTYQIYKE